MKRIFTLMFLAAVLLSAPALSDDQSLDAAVGGAVGGGLGAFIGNELGGRDGAILGGAVGAATGAAVTTDHRDHRPSPPRYYVYPAGPRPHHRGPPPRRFCPPGQAKKGRC
jgi:hypothetical protein